jgi:signal transduction histidine kinase/CheY-like chemotaxis protein
MESSPRGVLTATSRRTLARPLPMAIAAAGVTAAILITLGALTVVTMRRVMLRDAEAVVVAGAKAAAATLRPEWLSPGLAQDSSGAEAREGFTRALRAVSAAMEDTAVAEVLLLSGDSLHVAADIMAPTRRGTVFPAPASVLTAWQSGSAAHEAVSFGTRNTPGVRILAPVRRPDGTVVGAVSVMTGLGSFLEWDAEIRETLLAGTAVAIGLALLAGFGVYRVEASRAESAAQLVAAKEAAEEIARSRGEFLANMSHEIRTPLHGVLGMTEALLAMPHTEADRRSLSVINRSASSLLGILNDILDYSKLEAGRVELVHAPFDARALVDDVTDLFAVRAEEKNLDLAVREITRCDHWPVGDAARIRQVLLNLVGNAVKFTEKGGVQVELSTVAIGRKTVVLRIAVRDTGIGIAPDVQARVFEQFAQAESSTARRFGGTGLGLTISRQLVMLMGGSISVSSVPGEGSEFVVNMQLPAAPVGAEQSMILPFPVGERVLVCTPLGATMAALTELCTRERLTVTACKSVEEANSALERGDRFAAVFCDSALAKGEPHPLGHRKTPLVMLTTVHHPMNNSTLSALGAVAQLRRPVRQDHFSAVVSELAGGKLTVPAPTPITTPAVAAPRPVVKAAATPEPAQPVIPKGMPRVLVVDDVDLNLIVAKAMLASLGVTVRTAAGGEEALDVLSKEQMDLVLMDCHMPGLDGYDVTKCVRGSPGPNRETPIVALSASAFAEDRERAIASGMNDFATKPIELEGLRGVLTRWTAKAEPVEAVR